MCILESDSPVKYTIETHITVLTMSKMLERKNKSKVTGKIKLSPGYKQKEGN